MNPADGLKCPFCARAPVISTEMDPYRKRGPGDFYAESVTTRRCSSGHEWTVEVAIVGVRNPEAAAQPSTINGAGGGIPGGDR